MGFYVLMYSVAFVWTFCAVRPREDFLFIAAGSFLPREWIASGDQAEGLCSLLKRILLDDVFYVRVLLYEVRTRELRCASF